MQTIIASAPESPIILFFEKPDPQFAGEIEDAFNGRFKGSIDFKTVNSETDARALRFGADGLENGLIVLGRNLWHGFSVKLATEALGIVILNGKGSSRYSVNHSELE